MELLEFLLYVLLFYSFFKLLAAWIEFVTMKKLVQTTVHSVVSEMHQLAYVDKVNDVMYLYRKLDGKFLAQGKTYDELLSHLKSRFKNGVSYYIIDKDAPVLSTEEK